MLMERTLQVVKRALRVAGLLIKVAILENFVDNEIVIKFPKQNVDLEEEYSNFPIAIEEDHEFEPADSTCQETSNLNSSVTTGPSFSDPFVKLERLHHNSFDHSSFNSHDERSDNRDDYETKAIAKNNDLSDSKTCSHCHQTFSNAVNRQRHELKKHPKKAALYDNGEDHEVGGNYDCNDESNDGELNDNSDIADGIDDRSNEKNEFRIILDDIDPNFSPNRNAEEPIKSKTKKRKSKKKDPQNRKTKVCKIPARPLKPYLHCDRCDFRNRSVATLDRHIAAKHVKFKPYKCPFCKYKTSVEIYLFAHLKTHPGVLPYKCNECDHGCQTAADLKVHKAARHEKPKTYNCRTCAFVGKNRIEFLRHVQCHFNDDDENGEQTPVGHDASDVHCMLNATEDVAKSICTLCGRKYLSGIWLEQHMQQHMDPEKYSLLCSHCDTKFNNKHALKAHLNSLTGEAPFSCIPCDTDTTYDNNLASSQTVDTAGGPKLIQSKRGLMQIQDQGYVLCLNKAFKNNRAYLRCCNRDKSGCSATGFVVGPLEEGKFKLEWHNVEKHNHEPCTMENLEKQFDMIFKRACLERVGVPIPIVFEECKVNFLTSLTPAEQPLFQGRVSTKNKVMTGYRIRCSAGYNEPTTEPSTAGPDPLSAGPMS